MKPNLYRFPTAGVSAWLQVHRVASLRGAKQAETFQMNHEEGSTELWNYCGTLEVPTTKGGTGGIICSDSEGL
jgi:hypothetical protein